MALERLNGERRGSAREGRHGETSKGEHGDGALLEVHWGARGKGGRCRVPVGTWRGGGARGLKGGTGTGR